MSEAAQSPMPVYADLAGAIFDCDGTLADTMPLHFRAWTAVLADYGAAMSERLFYDLAGVPSVRIVEILNERSGLRLNPAEIAREKEARYVTLLPEARPAAAVLTAVRAYRGQARLAVASGGLRALVEQTLVNLGIRELFDVIVTAEDVARGKPAPDLFLLAAQRLGVPPAGCVVYEDAELGLEAARSAGMRAVDVRPWLQPPVN